MGLTRNLSQRSALLLFAGLGLIYVGQFLVQAQDSSSSGSSQNSAENFANLAERISDRQHEKYCNRFERSFRAEPETLWPKVKKQCIERLIYKDVGKDGDQQQSAQDNLSGTLPAPIAKLNIDMRQKIIGIYGNCSLLVKNPCEKNDWTEVKQCIRDEGQKSKLAPNGLPKNLGSVGFALSANLMECTAKIVNPKSRK